MKTLKKYFKVILCFMAFAVASFAFAFSPVSPVFAVTSPFILELATKAKMPTKVDAQTEDLRIPLLDGRTVGDEYEIRVYDAAGKEHVYDGTASDYFTVSGNYVVVAKEKLVGSSNPYRVVYASTFADYYFCSKEYRIFVTDASYTLKLVEADNTNVLIPSKLAKSSEASAKIQLPTRALINDEVHTSDVTVKLFKDNKLKLSYTLGTEPETNPYIADGKFAPAEVGEYTISYTANKCDIIRYNFAVEEGYVAPAAEDINFETPSISGVELGKKDIKLPSLKITDKKGNNVAYNLKKVTITHADNANIKQELSANTYVFDMTKDKFGAADYASMVGKYNFVFEVVDVYGHTLTKTVEVKGVTDSTAPTVYMAYNYELDDDTKLPKTEVNTHANVDVKPSVGYKELVLPAIYAEDYVSTYSDIKFVRSLKSTSSSKEYFVDNLILHNNKIEKLEYVEETVDEQVVGYFKNKDDATDSTRYNGNFALVSYDGQNYTTAYGNVTSSVSVKFAKEYDADYIKDYCGDNGEYQIRYLAFTNVVNYQQKYYLTSSSSDSYPTIKVEATDARHRDETSPSVVINNIIDRSAVEKSSKLTVKTTSVDAESTNPLKTSVYYKNYADITTIDLADISDDAYLALQAALATGYEDDDLLSGYGKSNVLDSEKFLSEFGFTPATNNATADGSYELEFGEDTGYYAVVALTINKDNKLGVALKTLRIKYTEDEDAPTANAADWDNWKKVAQQSVVELPDVTFTDDDSDLSLNVAYYVGNPAGEVGYDFLVPNAYHYAGNTIGGVKINADLAGEYYVVYTATDDAGNSTFVYFTFIAKQTADPVLTVGANGEGITKSGNTVTGELTPSGLTVNFDVDLFSADGKYRYTYDDGGDDTVTDRYVGYEINANGVRVENNGANSFTLLSEGSITITFSGWVEYDVGGTVRRDAISKTYTITANLPSFAWTNENKLTELDTVAEKDVSIELPQLVATHGAYAVSATEIKVEHILNGKTEDVTDAVLTDYTFTPNKENGRFVVTYTAKSGYGSTITATHTFVVGDTSKPTFVVSGDAELRKDLSLVENGVIKYNVNWNVGQKTFKVTIDGKEYPLNITINDTDKSGTTKVLDWTTLNVKLLKDGSTVSAVSGYNYEIKETGAYVLRLSVKDANDNEGTYDISFNVVKASEPSTKTDLVLGIVLIVISVLVLAGAIVFFIFAGRKGGKGKGKKNKNVEDNSNNEDNNSDAKSGDVE